MPLANCDKPPGDRGLRCQACGHQSFRVVYVRPAPGGVLRRRECRNCGTRITTSERALAKWKSHCAENDDFA